MASKIRWFLAFVACATANGLVLQSMNRYFALHLSVFIAAAAGLVVTVIAGMVERFTRKRVRMMRPVAFYGLSLLLSFPFVVAAEPVLFAADRWRAERYVSERAGPWLESQRMVSGQYPASWNPRSDPGPKPPALLQAAYTSDGISYRIYFPNSSPFGQYTVYESTTRSWENHRYHEWF